MKVFKLRRARSHVHRSRRYPMYVSIAALLVLGILLTIVSISKNRVQQKLTLGQHQLAAQIQSNLNSAIQKSEKMSLPGANISDDILPTMQLHMFAADELNEVMIGTYGQESSMINGDIYTQIELAFTQLERNITEGKSTSSTQETLVTYMAQMESDLNARFAGSELLMSRGSLK